MAKQSPSPSTEEAYLPEAKEASRSGTAEDFRRQLELNKVAQEKLNQRNTSSNDYVKKAEKAEQDIAKALEDYKNAVEKLQLAKKDATNTNEYEVKEATTEIDGNKDKLESAISDVDKPIWDLRAKIKDLNQKKLQANQRFSDAQGKLAETQTELQNGLAYQADIAAKFKAISDLEAKIQKVNDHAHPAEFYFYTKETAKLLGDLKVQALDELKTDLTNKLKDFEQALADVIEANGYLIDGTIDLDLAQKQLSELEKNRETQILAEIKQFD